MEKPVKFPQECIFIGFEWINNKENIYVQKYYTENNSGKPYIMTDYNSVSIKAQLSQNDEIWILGKIVWDTPEGKLLKTGTFRQENWLNYKDFLDTNNSDKENNRRLSIQLDLTD